MNKIVLCEFNAASDHYSYHTDLEVKVGDLVIVECDGHSNFYGFCAVRVVKTQGLTLHQQDKATKWIVSILDLEAHQKRRKTEELKQEIRNELKAEMDRFQEIQVYQQLAKDNSKIKGLLKQLALIDPTVKVLPAPKKRSQKK